jgi:hypothetical protein
MVDASLYYAPGAWQHSCVQRGYFSLPSPLPSLTSAQTSANNELQSNNDGVTLFLSFFFSAYVQVGGIATSTSIGGTSDGRGRILWATVRSTVIL